MKRTIRFLVVLVLAASCRRSQYRSPLEGTEYVPQVPEDEVAGTWTLSHDAEAKLQLQADHSCISTPTLTAYFQDCEQTYPAKDPPSAGCRWRVEQGRDSGQVVVTFKGRSDAWLSAGFGVFRNRQVRTLVLVGTCGSGDAYGLWPLKDERSDEASRGRRTRG